MLRLIPGVKKLDIRGGFLEKNAISYGDLKCDERVVAALKKLPLSISFFMVATVGILPRVTS